MSGPVDPPVGGKGHVADGITVLEASAGTGKTFRVTTIVVTAVADGLPLSDMLLVTFTIKATSELRDRVWHRLGESARAVADFLDAGVAPDDPLHHDLCAGPDDAVRAPFLMAPAPFPDADADARPALAIASRAFSAAVDVAERNPNALSSTSAGGRGFVGDDSARGRCIV